MKRLEFLKGKFNILPKEDFDVEVETLNEAHMGMGVDVDTEAMKAYVKGNTILINELAFNDIVDADPTKNKMYTQWLLSMLVSELKKGEVMGIRFLNEDLPKTKENLELFDGNKRKKKFKELTKKNYATKQLNDPTNINQYTALDQLYAAVFPFKPVTDLSELETQLDYYVSVGEAEIPVKDDYYTIFIPKSLKASELFSFTAWCTASKGNSMFNHYKKQKKPNGELSDLYIVIDNKYFKGESDRLYQIHFESGQVMDSHDTTFKGMDDEVLSNNTSVRNFFFEELKGLFLMSMQNGSDKGKGGINSINVDNNRYMEYIMKFGFSDLLFEVLEDDVLSIKFENISIKKLPDLSRFRRVNTIYLDNVGLTELNDDMFKSQEMQMISIPRNKIKSIPKSISSCKSLKFINLMGNPIEEIPESIKYLDPMNGGSLFKMTISTNEHNINKLRDLLPSVSLTT